MKTSLSILGAASLLGLVTLAATPAQGQTASQTISFSPNNSSVKVNDYSSPGLLSVTMQGAASSQKNMKASAQGSQSGGAKSTGWENFKPSATGHTMTASEKKSAAKAAEQKKTTAAR